MPNGKDGYVKFNDPLGKIVPDLFDWLTTDDNNGPRVSWHGTVNLHSFSNEPFFERRDASIVKG